jgi:shikimate dehydrogenase
MSAKMQNIVLIGMPGCGKSTIANLLAEKTCRKIVDADQEVEKKAGKPIPQIFAEDGEEAFRKLETEVLAELGKQSQLIIATGGGCVTRPENFPLLHQNSSIFWLKRDWSLLPTDGRPLSLTNRLADMYSVRKPLYEAFADYQVDNNGTYEG